MSLFIQFIQFFLYAVLIIIVAKYLMIYFIRKISQLYKLSNNTTGQILGYATSTPELIGGIAAATVGMISTSLFNILSSNIINVFLFLSALFYNKKQSELIKKKFIDEYIIILISIILPILIMLLNLQTNIIIIPVFLGLFILYIYIDRKINKHITEDSEEIVELNVEPIMKRNKTIFYSFMLLLSIIILYYLGNLLGNTLEILGYKFGVSELLLGVLMGFITSLPELTSFFNAYSHHGDQGDDATVEALNNLTSSNVSNLFIIQTISLIIYLIFQ